MPYHKAQICLNGHVVSTYADEYLDSLEKFCSKCGAKTIMSCPTCNAAIRGSDTEYGYLSEYDLPYYCIDCGNPYPWTKTAIENASLLIREDQLISEQDANLIVESLPNIIVETPSTKLASSRIKRILSTAGKFTAEGIKDFVVDFGCELAKKSFGL